MFRTLSTGFLSAFVMLTSSQIAVAAPSAIRFEQDGQIGWQHDEGHSGGFFHTFDALKVGLPAQPAHKVHLFLPRDYSSSQERYPVLYMNDGQTAFFPGGPTPNTWRTAETLSDLYAKNEIRKIIVVAVHPVDRNREYSPDEDSPGASCCEVANYARYLANDVKTWIDRNYRTLPDRLHTAIIGSSRGGVGAFYVAAAQPAVFGFAGCLSPSFWVGIDTRPDPSLNLSNSRLIREVQSGLAQSSHPTFWIDWGLVRTGGSHNEWIEAHATTRSKEMVRLLQERFGYLLNRDLFTMEDPWGQHTENSWAGRLPFVLKTFFAPNR